MKQRAARAGGDWFPYYLNASTSDRVLNLRADRGLAGFGLYILLLERQLRRKKGIKPQHYKAVAYELQTKPEYVKAVIEDYDLFRIGADGKTYYACHLSHYPDNPPCGEFNPLCNQTHPGYQEVSTATGNNTTGAPADGPQFAATKNDAKSTVSTLYIPTPNGSEAPIFGSDEMLQKKEKESPPPCTPLSKEKEKKLIIKKRKKANFDFLSDEEKIEYAAAEFPAWRVAMEEKAGGRAALEQHFVEFFAWCKESGRQHKTAELFRYHFNAWLDIQLTNQTHNHDTTTTKSQTGTRTNAIPPAAFARAMPGSLEARLGYTEGCGVKRRPTPPD